MVRAAVFHTISTVTSLSLCFAVSTSLIAFSAEPAFANNGKGNGNGNGRGISDRGNDRGNTNRGADHASNRGNGNGRGAIASELKGLNAAHASPTALANASPDSMPGKLNTYREARLALVDAVDEQNLAYDEFQRLSGLTEDEVAAEFPDGGYEDALNGAANTYAALREAALAAQTDSKDSLLTLTEGRELSEAAMAELHNLLGL